MSSQVPTSLVSLESCPHARMRRTERGITKRQVRRARKYGTPIKQYDGKWRFEHEGIILITGPDMRSEVTSYHPPPPMKLITNAEMHVHNKAKAEMQQKPEMCRSHTILVVDNSGSMQTHDIPAYRDRQSAAYISLAREFVSRRLLQRTTDSYDVASLVEFDESAHCVFVREPVSWILYNKLLSRVEDGGYSTRKRIKEREATRADSNYLPALLAATQLIADGYHEKCALGVFFLSDGAPSDARHFGGHQQYALARIAETVYYMSMQYKDTISFHAVGIGNPTTDFTTLSSMANASNQATQLGRAKFTYCGKSAYDIGTSISSLGSSLTDSFTSNILIQPKRMATKRRVLSEQETGHRDVWRYFKICQQQVYNPKTENLATINGLPPGALDLGYEVKRNVKKPNYLAINASSCGSGAERLAFRSFLSFSPRPGAFAHAPLVAKEANLVHHALLRERFHRSFCRAQSLASLLAKEFNDCLRLATKSMHDFSPPVVSFLPCSVLTLEDAADPGTIKCVLVEKMLETDRFQWNKWNNNGGAVEDKATIAPIDIEQEFRLMMKGWSANENTLYDNGPNDETVHDDHRKKFLYTDGDDRDQVSIHNATPSMYLQAFSHFTFYHTNGKFLVCDLQGILNTDEVPNKFELTDPAIHYVSKDEYGHQSPFGRTDKGEKGVNCFFKTHNCTCICRLLLETTDRQHMNLSEVWRKQFQAEFGPQIVLEESIHQRTVPSDVAKAWYLQRQQSLLDSYASLGPPDGQCNRPK